MAVGVRNLLKSLVAGPSLLGDCYIENKFHKNNTRSIEGSDGQFKKLTYVT